MDPEEQERGGLSRKYGENNSRKEGQGVEIMLEGLKLKKKKKLSTEKIEKSGVEQRGLDGKYFK